MILAGRAPDVNGPASIRATRSNSRGVSIYKREIPAAGEIADINTLSLAHPKPPCPGASHASAPQMSELKSGFGFDPLHMEEGTCDIVGADAEAQYLPSGSVSPWEVFLDSVSPGPLDRLTG